MFTANISTVVSNISSVSTQPLVNFLRPNAFRFQIKNLPGVNYTCQSANLPSLALGSALQPSPFVDIPHVGDKNSFGDFTIRFLIAEDMSNYIQIYEWLVALGFPNSYNQYRNFTGDRLNLFPFVKDARGAPIAVAYSDATLTIMDSNNIPKTNMNFKDAFPISVEALDFDITSSSVEYFVGIASFKYKTFEIEAL
ncbi:MAG: hypothetical protein ACO294_08195 [Methylococcales bacterium]